MLPARCNILTFATGSIDLGPSEMDNMTVQVIRTLDTILTNQDPSTRSTMLADIEHYFISLWPVEIPSQPSDMPSNSSISEHTLPAIIIALHLDTYLPELVITPSILPTEGSLITQLKYHLNLSAIHSLWYPVPGALLWCLVVGVEASQSTSLHPWFVANLMRAVTALGFIDGEGVKSCMQQLMRRGVGHI